MKKIIIKIINIIFNSPVKDSSTLQKHEPTNQREKRLMYNCFKHDFK